MNFISIEFLIAFPLSCLVYEKLEKEKRWIWLLIMSLGFYFYWNHWSILLLLTVTAFTFFCGKQIKKRSGHAKKGWLTAAAVCTLGLLFILKYAGLGLALPVGISFYTFQTLSYVIDVYRGECEPEDNFAYYVLYVSFFPQLVAGPIERSKHLLSQLHNPKTVTRKMKMEGFAKMLFGFYKKIVIADFVSGYVDSVYGKVSAANGPAAVAATVLFAFQIYCDFSGYSDIAVGAAKIMGIELMENFNQPYLAASFRDFWRRWHISLTKWFTDYVYIPLGGSRKGKARTYINILIVFALSGIWHGAGATFLVWGLIHGIALVIERAVPVHRTGKIRNIGKRILVFAVVCFAWIFFRANTIGEAVTLIRLMGSGWNPSGIMQMSAMTGMSIRSILRIVITICTLPVLHSVVKKASEYDWKDSEEEKHIAAYYAAVGAFVFAVGAAWIFNLSVNPANSFIYFEF